MYLYDIQIFLIYSVFLNRVSTQGIVQDDDDEVEMYTIGFLAPWNSTFDDFSALTSASAIDIALEAIAKSELNAKMRFK